MKTALQILNDNMNDSDNWVNGDYSSIIAAMHTYAAQFKQEWIDVKDRLPEIQKSYMVYLPHIDKIEVVSFIWTGSEWKWSSYNDYITHWMKLPIVPIKFMRW